MKVSTIRLAVVATVLALVSITWSVVEAKQRDAKSTAISAYAKSQANRERGKIRHGRKIESLGKECKLEVAPLQDLVKNGKPGQERRINILVEDVVPICE